MVLTPPPPPHLSLHNLIPPTEWEERLKKLNRGSRMPVLAKKGSDVEASKSKVGKFFSYFLWIGSQGLRGPLHKKSIICNFFVFDEFAGYSRLYATLHSITIEIRYPVHCLLSRVATEIIWRKLPKLFTTWSRNSPCCTVYWELNSLQYTVHWRK